jgi:hypothetical protein
MNAGVRCLVVVAVVCAGGGLRASGVPEGRAKELRQRFEEGCGLVAQNRLEPALEVFAGILREDAEARGSLLMSGLVENRRFRFAEAAGFFERFARLEPAHEQGLMGWIKALHGAGRAADAEPVRLRLIQLRQSGKSAKLRVMASYEREVVPLAGGGWISVQEYFDDAEMKPRWAWLRMKGEPVVERRLQLVRLPEAEAKTLRASNAALAPGPVFALSEPVYEGGEFRRTKIHRFVSGAAGYAEVRGLALDLLAE